MQPGVGFQGCLRVHEEAGEQAGSGLLLSLHPAPSCLLPLSSPGLITGCSLSLSLSGLMETAESLENIVCPYGLPVSIMELRHLSVHISARWSAYWQQLGLNRVQMPLTDF